MTGGDVTAGTVVGVTTAACRRTVVVSVVVVGVDVGLGEVTAALRCDAVVGGWVGFEVSGPAATGRPNDSWDTSKPASLSA